MAHERDKLTDAFKEVAELQDNERKQSNWPKDMEINGFKLVLTCPACPEQYDVHAPDGQLAGYLRLRHGWFRADVPTCGGDTIYESHPNGDGIFDDDERVPELTKAVAAIKQWWEERSKSEPG